MLFNIARGRGDSRLPADYRDRKVRSGRSPTTYDELATAYAKNNIVENCWRFNGAALFRARKGDCPSTFPRPMRGFNGAALFRARKAQENAVTTLANNASMGPRFLERGRRGIVEDELVTDDASMGPRFLERGRAANGSSEASA